jgi:hypothetical protein
LATRGFAQPEEYYTDDAHWELPKDGFGVETEAQEKHILDHVKHMEINNQEQY